MSFSLNTVLSATYSYEYFDETTDISYLKPAKLKFNGDDGTANFTVDGKDIVFPIDLPLRHSSEFSTYDTIQHNASLNKWTIKRETNIIYYDGTEDWQLWKSNTFILPAEADMKRPYSNSNYMVYLYNIGKSSHSYLSVYKCNNCIAIGTENVAVHLDNTITTVEQFKSVLANLYEIGRPLTICYMLKEESCTETVLPWSTQKYLFYLCGIHLAEPVKQSNKIILYNMNETDFSHFGLRILTPTDCKITEELNGMYELEMEHPVDADGTWAMIDELDIIKANSQLFRIYRIIRKMNADGSKAISVNARHIFYDLNDRLLIDVRPTDCNGQQALDWIMSNTFKASNDIFNEYEFYAKSDIETVNTAYYQNMSPVQALLGADNCFLNRWGGELYRNNFYFSINSKMENAKDDAFNILYALNMFEIEETIDYSDFCSYMLAVDNYGNRFAKSYSAIEGSIPHNFYKKITFNYDEYDFEAFKHDASLYFDTICTPTVNYKVSFANLTDTELYKDFISLSRCEVGDRGIVRNEKLNIETMQQIIRKVYDVINQKVESIELGNIQASLTRNGSFSNTISSGNNITDKIQAELRKTQIRAISANISALESYPINEIEGFTINELEGNI